MASEDGVLRPIYCSRHGVQTYASDCGECRMYRDARNAYVEQRLQFNKSEYELEAEKLRKCIAELDDELRAKSKQVEELKQLARMLVKHL